MKGSATTTFVIGRISIETLPPTSGNSLRLNTLDTGDQEIWSDSISLNSECIHEKVYERICILVRPCCLQTSKKHSNDALHQRLKSCTMHVVNFEVPIKLDTLTEVYIA